jgi:hypothetical protein
LKQQFSSVRQEIESNKKNNKSRNAPTENQHHNPNSTSNPPVQNRQKTPASTPPKRTIEEVSSSSSSSTPPKQVQQIVQDENVEQRQDKLDSKLDSLTSMVGTVFETVKRMSFGNSEVDNDVQMYDQEHEEEDEKLISF